MGGGASSLIGTFGSACRSRQQAAKHQHRDKVWHPRPGHLYYAEFKRQRGCWIGWFRGLATPQQFNNSNTCVTDYFNVFSAYSQRPLKFVKTEVIKRGIIDEHRSAERCSGGDNR